MPNLREIFNKGKIYANCLKKKFNCPQNLATNESKSTTKKALLNHKSMKTINCKNCHNFHKGSNYEDKSRQPIKCGCVLKGVCKRFAANFVSLEEGEGCSIGPGLWLWAKHEYRAPNFSCQRQVAKYQTV